MTVMNISIGFTTVSCSKNVLLYVVHGTEF